MPGSTIRDFTTGWLTNKQPEWSERTHEKYTGVINCFLDTLGPMADNEILLLRKVHIAGFQKKVAKEKSPATANTMLKIIRAMLNEARREELIDNNPAELVTVLKIRRPDDDGGRRVFTMKQVKAMLEVAEPEMRLLIRLGLYTGQRLGDLCNLKWGQIDLELGEIRIQTSKTGRRQKIPIAGALRSDLLTLEQGQPENPLMPEINAYYQRAKSSGMSKRFRAVMVKAGIVEKRKHKATSQGRAGPRKVAPYSFHCFRHTLTTMLKAAGVSAPVAQEIIGHDSEAMNRHYTHLDSAVLRDALNQIPEA